MADIKSKEDRSRNMAAIKGKDTKPEMIVRKYLFSKGLRYRLHDKRLPGSPDIVLKKYKTVIFIDGCFWHRHEGCKYYRLPKSNEFYWELKIRRNKARDISNDYVLQTEGWKVIRIWECEIKKVKGREKFLEFLYRKIISRSCSYQTEEKPLQAVAESINTYYIDFKPK